MFLGRSCGLSEHGIFCYISSSLQQHRDKLAFVPAGPRREALAAVIDEHEARVVPGLAGCPCGMLHGDFNDENVLVEGGADPPLLCRVDDVVRLGATRPLAVAGRGLDHVVDRAELRVREQRLQCWGAVSLAEASFNHEVQLMTDSQRLAGEREDLDWCNSTRSRVMAVFIQICEWL